MTPTQFILTAVIFHLSRSAVAVATYSYATNFLQVPLDHFSFAVNQTLMLRYLYNDTYWNRVGKGPIFIYTGNEGNIESFAENTGFMWEIAEEFGALVVFAEHRFYGKSFPGKSPFSSVDDRKLRDVLGYLTVEQVLADFAKLIVWLKKSMDAEQCPVIAFGGSYGGQLTAYLRMKYPHIVQGGIASSAPLFLTEGRCEVHDKTLKQVFAAESAKCADLIKTSWSSINNLSVTDEGKQWLKSCWKLCSPVNTLENVTALKSWLQIMYSSMGMVNYPYPTNFFQDLPGHPVREFCNKLTDVTPVNEMNKDKALLAKLYGGVNLYFNYSGTTACMDYLNIAETNTAFSESDSESFNFQSCTELLDPSCDNGIDDFFEPQQWSFEDFASQCQHDFSVTPQPERLDVYFGGRNIFGASNIVFSNGLLDPWSGYGVLQNLSDSLLAIVMPDAAHHLDLRASNPLDPPSVVSARGFEKNAIRNWIQEFHINQLRLQELRMLHS